MSVKDDGNAAFPMPGSEHNNPWYGMSLRDYFAAKAMQGMVAAEFGATFSPEHWAEYSYKIADAMLAARGESK